MTSEQIDKLEISRGTPGEMQISNMLREIAYQLALLNEREEEKLMRTRE